jgi:tetratricopeptide (TPR) repeat protein
MRAWVMLGFSGLIGVHSIQAADARWNRVASPNFEMYSTAGERSARETIRHFEQVRSFFDQMMPHPVERPSRVLILAFSSLKEYEPYRLNDYATAYYHAAADHDCIVMSQVGAESFPTAIHEYVHLLTRHSKLNFPPWLNEGIAEFYSTIDPTGDKVLVGSFPENVRRSLEARWVPLETILTARYDSAYYKEKTTAGSLYNEGWALMHMLALHPEYQAKSSQVLAAISDGTASVEALEQIYGKPLRRIETDLQAYLRGAKLQGALVPAKLEKMEGDLKVEPADEFDIALLLSEVTDRPGREEATRAALEGLIARNPKRPEAYVDLAYLQWRQREMKEARADFAKAFELGSRNPRMLRDYGRMVEKKDAPQVIPALAELVKQDPDDLETRLELASLQLRSDAAKDALQTLAPVQQVTPANAPKLLTLLAYANLEVGDRVMARNVAHQLKGVAISAEDRDRADQILKFIDSARPDGAKQ